MKGYERNKKRENSHGAVFLLFIETKYNERI